MWAEEPPAAAAPAPVLAVSAPPDDDLDALADTADQLSSQDDPAPRPVAATLSPDVPVTAAPAPRSLDEPPAPSRRTVVIRGHGHGTYVPQRRGYEARLKRHERSGFKPDRVALWAVLLGLALLLGAVTSSHAAVLHHAAILHQTVLNHAVLHHAAALHHAGAAHRL
jgi:hypothetical protein